MLELVIHRIRQRDGTIQDTFARQRSQDQGGQILARRHDLAP
jgi:hypothetical protein